MSLRDSAAHLADGLSLATNKQRVVVDTSVLISAIFFGGREIQVLLQVAQHQKLIVSDYIVDELIAFAKNTLPKTSRQMVRYLRETLMIFAVEYEATEVEVRDVNDAPIIQLALAHDALILSSDKDLLEYRDDARVAILTTGEYEALFRQD